MRRLPLSMLAFLGAPVAARPAPAERIPQCTFDAGALPAQTMPHHRAAIPIDQIVVLMQDRSFDHYFGQLHYQGQRRARRCRRMPRTPAPRTRAGPRSASSTR
jgi:phospholipase C